MKREQKVTNLNHATYTVTLAALTTGLILVFFNVQSAFLAAAVIFGWSQIGGL